jgi:hypothetical protein
MKLSNSDNEDNSEESSKSRCHRITISLDNDIINKMPSQLPPRPILLSDNEEENEILQTLKIMREAGNNPDGTFVLQEEITELTRKVVALRRAKGNY